MKSGWGRLPDAMRATIVAVHPRRITVRFPRPDSLPSDQRRRLEELERTTWDLREHVRPLPPVAPPEDFMLREGDMAQVDRGPGIGWFDVQVTGVNAASGAIKVGGSERWRSEDRPSALPPALPSPPVHSDPNAMALARLRRRLSAHPRGELATTP